MRTFIEYDNGIVSPPDLWFPAKSYVNSYSTYEVLDDSVGGSISFYENGQTVDTLPLGLSSMDGVDVSSETNKNEPQIAGGLDNHNWAQWASILPGLNTSGAWTDMSGTASNNDPYAGESPANGTSGITAFQSWDTACTY